MPQVTIDGTTHEAEAGEKVLQLCLNEGTEVPHFCYHPSLSIPANCRQCLVKAGTPMFDRETKEPVLDDDGSQKINYFPKLMPSCALDVTEGMVVHTQLSSVEVAEAQADNLEIMLANHPLDCPICDQAGQCPLQIQAYKYGPEGVPLRVREGPQAQARPARPERGHGRRALHQLHALHAVYGRGHRDPPAHHHQPGR